MANFFHQVLVNPKKLNINSYGCVAQIKRPDKEEPYWRVFVTTIKEVDENGKWSAASSDRMIQISSNDYHDIARDVESDISKDLADKIINEAERIINLTQEEYDGNYYEVVTYWDFVPGKLEDMI